MYSPAPPKGGPFLLTLALTQKVEGGLPSKFSAEHSDLLCSSSLMIFPLKQKQFPTEHYNVSNNSLLVVIHMEQESKVLAFQNPKTHIQSYKSPATSVFPGGVRKGKIRGWGGGAKILNQKLEILNLLRSYANLTQGSVLQ